MFSFHTESFALVGPIAMTNEPKNGEGKVASAMEIIVVNAEFESKS